MDRRYWMIVIKVLGNIIVERKVNIVKYYIVLFLVVGYILVNSFLVSD